MDVCFGSGILQHSGDRAQTPASEGGNLSLKDRETYKYTVFKDVIARQIRSATLHGWDLEFALCPLAPTAIQEISFFIGSRQGHKNRNFPGWTFNSF
ncbi:MAG: hypothetical protein ACREE6_02250 [Limisphaerales bacterium]